MGVSLPPPGYHAIGIVGGKNLDNAGTLWRSAYQLGASFMFTVGLAPCPARPPSCPPPPSPSPPIPIPTLMPATQPPYKPSSTFPFRPPQKTPAPLDPFPKALVMLPLPPTRSRRRSGCRSTSSTTGRALRVARLEELNGSQSRWEGSHSRRLSIQNGPSTYWALRIQEYSPPDLSNPRPLLPPLAYPTPPPHPQ